MSEKVANSLFWEAKVITLKAFVIVSDNSPVCLESNSLVSLSYFRLLFVNRIFNVQNITQKTRKIIHITTLSFIMRYIINGMVTSILNITLVKIVTI